MVRIDISAFMEKHAVARLIGVRPLKRAIQHQLEHPLAQQILAGKFQPGDTIEVDIEWIELNQNKRQVQIYVKSRCTPSGNDVRQDGIQGLLRNHGRQA